MISREAILHIPKSNYAYAYDKDTLHLRIRTKKGEIDYATLRIGDPYKWAVGGLSGGNLAGTMAEGWIGGENFPMTKEGETEYFDYWIASYKPPKKRSRYAFILEGKGEKILFGEREIVLLNGGLSDERVLSNFTNFFCFPYLNGKDVNIHPRWTKDTVWYQIFPDRFNNGNPSISPKNVSPWGTIPNAENFMGGDLYGIIDKLDYLKDLGINGLYFCPIFEGYSNHKYDTIDYMNVDPHFGDKETFKLLVEEAHKRGMKVMLDAVFNHMGALSPLWQDVVKKGRNSKYANWFVINKFPVYEDKPIEEWDFWNLNYETFGDVAEMPKLNVEDKNCREYLLNVAKYWVEEFDIDGWRLDVANEVDHKYWREFREMLKEIKPDLYILGEIWHDSLPWLMGDQYDAVMNYPLSDAILDFIAYDKIDGEHLKYRINKAMLAYPKNVTESNFNLLDSHDTNRILSIVGEDREKLKQAFLLNFFQTGAQCIYYGTEIGMTGIKGMGSEMNRQCMIWDENKQDHELLDFFKKLIKIRKENKVFQEELQWLKIDKKFILIQKGNLCLAINKNKESMNIDLEEYFQGKELIDMFKNTKLRGQMEVLKKEFKLFEII